MPNLKQMSKPEKKLFLSMDLAERMMRVEQTVSASFHKYIPYTQTEYYKSMSQQQKTDFEKYMKRKKLKKTASLLALILPLFFIALFNFTFTGNAIKDNMGASSYNLLITALIILVIIFASILIFSMVNRKKREENMKSHVRVIDDILVKKGNTKK